MAPSTSCLKRVQSELRKLRDADLKEFALKRENARLVQGCDGVIQIDQTIWLRQDDESDLTRFTALICGVEGTPYEFGMYLFSVKIPDDYPFQPPKVKHLTTDGVFRTNPNLYANGKVCLSILGTWSGPGWTQILTLRTVLLSIQTLFCEDPLQNEPGYEKKNGVGRKQYPSYGKHNFGGNNFPGVSRYKDQYKDYTEAVRHANFRIAVEGQVRRGRGQNPQAASAPFRTIMERLFLRKYSEIEEAVKRKVCEIDWCGALNAVWSTEYVDYRARAKELEKCRMDLLGVDTGGGGEAKTAKRKAPSTSKAVDLTAPEEEVDGNNDEKKKKKKGEVVVVLDD